MIHMGWTVEKWKTNILLTHYDPRAPRAAKHKKILIFTDEAPTSVKRVIHLFMLEYHMGKPIWVNWKGNCIIWNTEDCMQRLCSTGTFGLWSGYLVMYTVGYSEDWIWMLSPINNYCCCPLIPVLQLPLDISSSNILRACLGGGLPTHRRPSTIINITTMLWATDLKGTLLCVDGFGGVSCLRVQLVLN